MVASNEVLDPTAVERKMYQSFWNDGITDLVVGLGVVLIGIVWLLDLAVLTIIVPVLLLPLWIFARKTISEPRAGFVRFSSARQERVHRVSATASIVGYGVLMAAGGLYLLFRGGSDPGPIAATVVRSMPTIILASVFLVVGFVLEMPKRSIGYAVMTLAVAGMGIIVPLDPSIQFLTVGALVMIGGGFVLRRFLSENPSSGAISLDEDAN